MRVTICLGVLSLMVSLAKSAPLPPVSTSSSTVARAPPAKAHPANSKSSALALAKEARPNPKTKINRPQKAKKPVDVEEDGTDEDLDEEETEEEEAEEEEVKPKTTKKRPNAKPKAEVKPDNTSEDIAKLAVDINTVIAATVPTVVVIAGAYGTHKLKMRHKAKILKALRKKRLRKKAEQKNKKVDEKDDLMAEDQEEATIDDEQDVSDGEEELSGDEELSDGEVSGDEDLSGDEEAVGDDDSNANPAFSDAESESEEEVYAAASKASHPSRSSRPVKQAKAKKAKDIEVTKSSTRSKLKAESRGDCFKRDLSTGTMVWKRCVIGENQKLPAAVVTKNSVEATQDQGVLLKSLDNPQIPTLPTDLLDHTIQQDAATLAVEVDRDLLSINGERALGRLPQADLEELGIGVERLLTHPLRS